MIGTPNGNLAPSRGSHPNEGANQPPVGHASLIMAALTIGLLLMAMQLWLLTVALDVYLAGQGREIGWLAVVSGLIFLGGLGMLWFLHRRPRVHGTTAG
jgi:hypothetical protein